MLTRIETQYMNAVIGIHDEIRKANERGVDWDALRNQAAVAAMQTMIGLFFDGARLATFEGDVARVAVKYADALIAELRKADEKQHGFTD